VDKPDELMVLQLDTVCEDCGKASFVRLDSLFGFSVEELLNLSRLLDECGITLDQLKVYL
jgi:hypothetical protein